MRVLKLAQSWTTMKVLPADTNPCIICYIANTFHILHHLPVQTQGAVEHHHLDIGRPWQPHLHPAYRHLHLRHPRHAGETLFTKTLPKAQRTRGLSSYHKFKQKS